MPHENGHGHDHGHGERHGDTFKIIIDRRPFDWPKPVITGAEIKNLAGVDQNSFEAWQDVPGPEDIPVGDNQEINLTPKRTERFFTGKKTTTEG